MKFASWLELASTVYSDIKTACSEEKMKDIKEKDYLIEELKSRLDGEFRKRTLLEDKLGKVRCDIGKILWDSKNRFWSSRYVKNHIVKLEKEFEWRS